MYQSTDARTQTRETTELDAEVSPSQFLRDLAKQYMGEVVVVHTGSATYVGRLLSLTAICLTLDCDSEWLDQRVITRIDSSRVEAVEVLPG